mgnify:CR=1 FL=1
MDVNSYTDRISNLTERAKEPNPYVRDTNIGERAYILALSAQIRAFREKHISRDDLTKVQAELKNELLKYYQQREMFDRHININNRYSPLLTQAEKTGCPVCRKIVRIFDGRER